MSLVQVQSAPPSQNEPSVHFLFLEIMVYNIYYCSIKGGNVNEGFCDVESW